MRALTIASASFAERIVPSSTCRAKSARMSRANARWFASSVKVSEIRSSSVVSSTAESGVGRESLDDCVSSIAAPPSRPPTHDLNRPRTFALPIAVDPVLQQEREPLQVIVRRAVAAFELDAVLERAVLDGDQPQRQRRHGAGGLQLPEQQELRVRQLPELDGLGGVGETQTLKPRLL